MRERMNQEAPPAIKSGLDGDVVADFPTESCGHAGAGNSALAILDKVVPLVVSHHKLSHHLALIFGIDDKRWKEVLFILIDAAEPVLMRVRLDAGIGHDFVAVADRH